MANEAVAASTSSRLRIERGDAHEFREEVIGLFERKGNVVFRQQFDWYYREQGQPTPISWLARGADGSVCGLCSTVLRTIRFQERQLTAGVLGNLIVDQGRGQGAFVAFALARAAKSLVTNREVDLLLGIPNKAAEPVLLKLGFQVIDRWQTYALVFRSHVPLQHKFGGVGTILSPAVDLLSAVYRLHSAWPHTGDRNFSLVALDDHDLGRLPVQAWQLPASSFVIDANPSYLRWRFLHEPVKKYKLIGIVNIVSGSICGYLVVHTAAGRLHICDCRTDVSRLSETQAIVCFCHGEQSRRNTVWVTALRSAPTLASLAASGFVRVPASLGGYPPFPLIAFWRPDHPLTNVFLQAYRWNLLPGFNDV